jgi:uncharacterized protein YfaS (alpha-2-macroglobulin family)
MDLYDVGDTVRIATTTPFANSAGTATDPTTVTLNVREPDGTVTAYTYAAAQVTKAGTGDFYKDVSVDASGVWAWEWIGTGTVAAAHSGAFRVAVSAVA